MELVKYALFKIFESIILRPFYLLMSMYVRLGRYEFSELRLGQEMTSEQLDQIRSFRYGMYEGTQSYLIPQNEMEKESELDLDYRSFHAVVYDEQQRIMAVSRFTPFPFETSSILGLERTRPYSRYLEISRLVCRKKKSGIGKRLLIHAGLFAIRSKRYDGFIAICRDENCKIFQKFGLKSLYQFNFEKRGSAPYNFICADFLKVSTSTLQHFRMKLAYKLTTLG